LDSGILAIRQEKDAGCGCLKLARKIPYTPPPCFHQRFRRDPAEWRTFGHRWWAFTTARLEVA
jgi:hypothetical protein